jgi:hypothetical protein
MEGQGGGEAQGVADQKIIIISVKEQFYTETLS